MIIDEKTEVTFPLKLLISIVSVIVIASWYVFTTQNRIGDLEHAQKMTEERFSNYIKQPGRNTMDVELLKKDLEYLHKEIEQLKRGLK
jgi:Tfp pilus assembly protein PilO